jgi:hypothetical protein
MKNEHVISILESKPFIALDQNEIAEIHDHALVCVSCRKAFAGAQVSAALLQERAREAFEPSPFFETRVLAALRERQVANEKWAWSRLWRTAGGLASSMVATVATLAILTFVMPGSQTTDSQNSAAVVNTYTTEAVVLDENTLADNQMSDSDVFAAIYDAGDEAVK